MTNHIEVYTNPRCPFCIRALELLEEKDQSPETYDVTKDQGLKEEMIERSNGRMTTPQIFINEMHIGGCDDLYDLEDSGELDKILGL